MPDVSVEGLKRERVRARAIEATIWGMPAVSMAAVRRSLKRDLDADFGDVVYFSDVMRPRHEFLTANHETPYVLHRVRPSAGPMVLDVPAASATAMLFGSAIDSWEVPLADVGATGDDAGKGGRYLFLPPGHDGRSAGRASSSCRHRPATCTSGCDRSPAARAPSPTQWPTASRLRTYPLADAGDPSAEPLHRRVPARVADPAQRSISTSCGCWPRW